MYFYTKMESMISRAIIDEARFALTQFRALCITGPRQSGKTTLSKALFKGKPYVNFEDPFVQSLFQEDPKKFLASYKGGAIFDEVQRVPELFRHLQVLMDKNTSRGQFILTGSNNFLLQEQVSQSLAGRAGYLTLLPFSYQELKNAKLPAGDILTNILTGGYPEIWSEKLNPQKWLSSYIQTYIQRDVRQLKNISNLALFSRFVFLCANYAGQILNRDELSRQVGVDTKTIQSWLGLLENSYILFQLQPWYNNLNKRIIKSPKIYFYDTGLLCTLLNITSKSGLKNHSMSGAIFENWCISEIKKNKCNEGEIGGLFYFRDHLGNEIDLIIEKETGPLAVEIKSASKPDKKLLEGLKYWKKYQPTAGAMLLYQGKSTSSADINIQLLSWEELDTVR
jgi:predicted AAA+ superfamily ATPase